MVLTFQWSMSGLVPRNTIIPSSRQSNHPRSTTETSSRRSLFFLLLHRMVPKGKEGQRTTFEFWCVFVGFFNYLTRFCNSTGTTAHQVLHCNCTCVFQPVEEMFMVDPGEEYTVGWIYPDSQQLVLLIRVWEYRSEKRCIKLFSKSRNGYLWHRVF